MIPFYWKMREEILIPIYIQNRRYTFANKDGDKLVKQQVSLAYQQ